MRGIERAADSSAREHYYSDTTILKSYRESGLYSIRSNLTTPIIWRVRMRMTYNNAELELEKEEPAMSRTAIVGGVRRSYSLLSSQYTHTTLDTTKLIWTPSTSPSTRYFSSDSSFYQVIHATETSFKAIHSLSHLPWWGVVITATIVLRSVLTLPLAVYQNRVIAKMELLLPTLKEYQEAVKHNVIVKCRRANLPVEEANRRLKKAVNN